MQRYSLKPLFTREEILARTSLIAQQISSDYQGGQPVMVGVLNGAFVFLADVIRYLTIDAAIDFVQVSSYGSSKCSSGTCILLKDISVDIAGRDVLIVEDIIDTGDTLQFLVQHLRAKKPQSIKICSLLDKRANRSRNILIDYCGFTIHDEFVVGFGLDYAEKFRALPALYVLTD